MKTIFIISFSCAWLCINAQTFTVVKRYGTPGTQQSSWDVETDRCGNIYSCGVINGVNTLAFDTVTLTTYGGNCGVVVKHDITGNTYWVKRFGNSGVYTECYDITTDDSCNFYVTGKWSGGNLIVDNSQTILAASGTFICKFSPTATLLWAKGFTGLNPGGVGRMGVTINQTGEMLLITTFSGSVTVESTPYTALGTTDVMLVMMDRNSNVQWSKQLTDYWQAHGYSVACDSLGYFFFSGLYKGSLVLGPDTLNGSFSGTDCVFIGKCDNMGTIHWGIKLSGNGTGGKVASDYTGNTYTSIGSNGYIFNCAVDSGGIASWSSQGNTTANFTPYGHAAAIEGNGNSYFTGVYYDNINFGTFSFGSGAFNDLFLAKYSFNGTMLFLKRISLTYTDRGQATKFFPPNKVLVSGQGSETTAAGQYDYLFAVYNDNTVILGEAQSEISDLFSLYPVPSTDFLYIDAPELHLGDDVVVEIYNIDGALVNTQQLANSTASPIDIRGLAAGTYLLKLIGVKLAYGTKVFVKD